VVENNFMFREIFLLIKDLLHELFYYFKIVIMCDSVLWVDLLVDLFILSTLNESLSDFE
jgi:hypothetical protein